MVMDYGAPDARRCVTVGAGAALRCDMGRSALQAAHNVHNKYGIPYARIALTAMLGENDVAANRFTPDDAAFLLREASALGLAGLHHWSLDRDRPCAAGSPRVSPRCHGLPGLPAGRFSDLFGAAAR
jgi:chitinase